jgi:hypothetical protein
MEGRGDGGIDGNMIDGVGGPYSYHWPHEH